MSVILAESVAITKSRLVKGFNGDNMNLNGRVISLENADKGFKAAGAVKTPYVSVIASGNRKGFAAGAVTAFNDYTKDIYVNKYNAESIINKYFDDMETVVGKCGIEDSRLSIGVLCAFEDCVVAAKTGNCHLLRFSDGELFEIALSDDEGGRGFQFVDVVCDGDMYALIGEECSADLDYEAIVDAFDSGKELKLMIKDFFSILSSDARGNDCSVILIKLQTDMERTYAAMPAENAENDYQQDIPVDPGAFEAEPPIDSNELEAAETVVDDSEKPENGPKPSRKKAILNFIPIAVLVIILAVAAGLYLATRPNNPFKEPESYSAGEVPLFVEDEEDGTQGDFNGSSGMVNVDDTEQGGNAGSVTTTTETTTRRDETTTNAQTEAPIVTTTESTPENDPETTTETTTAVPTETTTASETTTETTTVSETTTSSPEEDNEVPEDDDPERPIDAGNNEEL